MTDRSDDDGSGAGTDGSDTGPDDEGDGGSDGVRNSGPDDLPPVPEDPAAAVAADDHALPPADLQYPEFTFESGSVADDGSFDLSQDLDREEMSAWLEDLAGGLASHDVGVEAPDGRVTLGVAPEDVEMSFDPGEDHTGTFEVTLRFGAKAMTVQDADDPKVGARGGTGFVPLAMLTDDEGEYRCYSWIDDPTLD